MLPAIRVSECFLKNLLVRILERGKGFLDLAIDGFVLRWC
jgi:hypothetical protein